MEVRGKAVFPSIRSGHPEELHPSSFLWWEENFTQKFSTRPLRKMLVVVAHEQRR
jgi:hypothetical protein